MSSSGQYKRLEKKIPELESQDITYERNWQHALKKLEKMYSLAC